MTIREPTVGESLADFTQVGETWYLIDSECPECGEAVTSNGTVHQCMGHYEQTDYECTWWGIID